VTFPEQASYARDWISITLKNELEKEKVMIITIKKLTYSIRGYNQSNS
jgi:hypothetical protein